MSVERWDSPLHAHVGGSNNITKKLTKPKNNVTYISHLTSSSHVKALRSRGTMKTYLCQLGTLVCFASTLLLACEKEKVVVKVGESCHIDIKNGWKLCEPELICLTDELAAKLKPYPKSSEQLTTIKGSNTDDPARYDRVGFDKQVLKGICYTKVGIGEPCAQSEMCKEGVCITKDGEQPNMKVNLCGNP